MSEPLADRLKHFTPDGAVVDRDALLFACGRASVRPRRGWKALAAALAACQVLTLVLLWPRPASPPGPALVVQVPEPVAPAPPDASGWATLNRLVAQSPTGELPPAPASEPLVPDAPAPHVWAVPPELVAD
jgi:hypothetical protein